MPKRLCGLLLGALCWLAIQPVAVAQQAEEWRERINRGTVGIVSGGIDGTYIRIATDLASVLDTGDDLRVLAIMGKGSVQNINDLLYLKGIDVGIVQSDVLTYFEQQNIHANIHQRINYITKLYNEEFHLLARRDTATVADLEGKKVNFGVAGSGTYMTASIVFEKMGVEAEPVSFDQGLALEKLKAGEIDALVYVAGKPTQLFQKVRESDNLHFLEIPLTPAILETYFPSRFSNDDYPEVVRAEEQVKTIAVGAVMAVYNWQPGTSRHGKVARFIEAFFTRFDDFQVAPRHPKWQEVNLAASVPGWDRFAPAEEWLKRSAIKGEGGLRQAFETFLEKEAPGLANTLTTDEQKEALFQLFLKWQNRSDLTQ